MADPDHIVDANGVVQCALEVPDLVRDAGSERPQPQRAEHAILVGIHSGIG